MLIQNGLSHLLTHVMNHQDIILAKATRILSEWTVQLQHELFLAQNIDLQQTTCNNGLVFPGGLQSYKEKMYWGDHVSSIVRLLCASFDNHYLLVELLGILLNLTVLDIPCTSWRDIAADRMLNNFIERLLLPGVSNADILLNSIMLIRAVCTDEDTASMFISCSILGSICRIWRENSHETDLALQIVLLISQLLRFNRTAELTLGAAGKTLSLAFIQKRCLKHGFSKRFFYACSIDHHIRNYRRSSYYF